MEEDTISDNIKHPTSSKRLKISDDYSEVPLVQCFGDILSVDFQHDVVDTTTKPQLIHQEENTIKGNLKRIVQLHNKPYPYGCISSLLNVDFLQQVIKEIKDNSTVHFKESDLFKFYQSIDLANLPSSSSSSEASSSEASTTTTTMPSVLKLRSMLYSSEFRHYIEDINQLPRNTLIDQVDCACNCHMTGCHLMCHDDVIGTRKVSYILYLTENDPIWEKTEGGVLELYNSTPVEIESEQSTSTSKRRIPLNVPECTVLPIFNSLVFFVVEPGYSFHAVQEVLGDRPRLSIQGWYHTSHKPDNIEYSTLQRLKSYQNSQVVQEEDTEGPFTLIEYPKNHAMIINASQDDYDNNKTTDDSTTIKTLSESDRIYLQKYIRDTYLTNDAIITIRNRFVQDSSIQLCNFLLDEYVQTINPLLSMSDIDRNKYIDPTEDTYYEWGCTEKWNMIGPPHKQRFLEYSATGNDASDEADSPTDQLGDCLYNTIRCKLLQSIPFANYLAIITNLGYPNSYRGRVRRFRPGRDYTIAHYGLLTQRSVLDATLCFVKGCSTTTNNHNNLENDHSQDNPTSDHNGDTSNDASIPSTSNNKSADDEILEEADEIWQSGDCGGFECYISADDDGDDDKDDDGDDNNDTTTKKKKDTAPDEYNLDTDENENDTELLNVSASNNTLSLVYRDPGTMRFIKYLSHTNAPSSRYDVTMEYEFVNNDNNNDDDDDDDDDDYDDEDLLEENDEIKVNE